MNKKLPVALGLSAAALFISWRLFWPLGGGEKRLIDVPAGKAFYHLAEELEQKKIIRAALDMKLLIKLSGSPLLPKGEYELSPRQNLWRIFQILKQGREKEFLVRFPEGFNHYEMGEALKSSGWPAAEDFLKKVWDKDFIKSAFRGRFALNNNLNSLEGYLFPDSYRLKKYMSAETLIQTMLKRFWSAYNKLAAEACQKAPHLKGGFKKETRAQKACPAGKNLPLHQAVTLASLVEKETGLPEERALIAGVFYNRLDKNMKLQTDPSILYALYLNRGFGIEKNIRKKDILFSSPYNTYVVKGLPPGPIANPGEESLRAALWPEKSSYLYFVSRNDGGHKFSKTYKEHRKAVYKYQIKPFKK